MIGMIVFFVNKMGLKIMILVEEVGLTILILVEGAISKLVAVLS